MKSTRNPKAEGRGPKEGRNPKAEYGLALDADGDFWRSRDEPTGQPLELREEPPPKPPPQGLDERAAQFGEAIIDFAKTIPQGPVTNRLISQLVGAGTSVGANYCEADDAVSGKEFKQKIGLCRKESKETAFFLRMVAKAEPRLAPEARNLWPEAKELNLIFGAIWRK